MVELINERYANYYHANKMSTTFLFCLSIYFLIIIVPFLIGFTSTGSNKIQLLTIDFWIRAQYYFEQPSIKSRNQYIIVVQTLKENYFYTNIPEIMRQQQNSKLLPIVAMSEIQDESSVTELAKVQNFTIDVKLSQNALEIRFIQILIFYEYQLSQNVNLKMQGFADVTLQSSVGIRSALVIGELLLDQIHPIQAGGIERSRYNYPPYYDEDGALLSDQIQIIEAAQQRNGSSLILLTLLETIKLQYRSLIQPAYNDDSSEITMIFQVPKNQEIIYIPVLLETLKFAWVQYFSIFLIFWFFGQMLLSFVVENGVYPTYQVNDLPSTQRSYSKAKLD